MSIVQHASPQDSPTMDRVDSPMWTVDSDGRLGQPSAVGVGLATAGPKFGAPTPK